MEEHKDFAGFDKGVNRFLKKVSVLHLEGMHP